MRTFDVVIIGAGPAGLACAEALAGSALRVLVLERKRDIGAKTCAGGLTRHAIAFGVPHEQARVFHHQRVYVDSRPPYLIRMRHPVMTLSRTELADFQLKKLEGARNVELLRETRALSISADSVESDRGVFGFRALVAADGSQSLARRTLGLATRSGIALCYEVPQVTDEISFHFKPGVIRSGYLWIFPHREHTNVGIGFNPDVLTPGLAKVILQQFMRERGFSSDGLRMKGGLISHRYSGFRSGNVYLAGDAAGLASQATGEGIPYALVSGAEIGRRILDPSYPMGSFRCLLRMKKRQEAYWRHFENHPHLQRGLLAAFFTMIKNHWMQAYMGY